MAHGGSWLAACSWAPYQRIGGGDAPRAGSGPSRRALRRRTHLKETFMISGRAIPSFAALFLAATAFAPEASAEGCQDGPCTEVTTIERTFSLGSRFRVGVRMCPCEG